MSAKSDLFARLKYLTAATELPELIDVGIAVSEHNGVANLLRKGLGIVAFNILEDFIKDRSVEGLETLSNSAIAFNDLTEFLQESAIMGALSALSFRSNLVKKDGLDWKTLIQDESGKIHSTKGSPYQISKFSLVSSQSNISAIEVTNLLKAFGITGGWQKMKNVSDSIGGGLPDLNQAFNNAASRRHNAAHVAAYQYDYTYISNLKNEILAIAASLDILITARCRQVLADSVKKIDLHNIDAELNYRFLEPSGLLFKETRTIAGSSRKNWTLLQNAIDDLQPRLIARHEFLIVLNSSRRIEDWHV